MSRGKYLSLEEARKAGKLKAFAKANPALGDDGTFNRLLDAMAGGKPSAEDRTSDREISED